MASVSSVSSSNLSSLYNSANTISGLASGLDTEGMIESLVQSYETKIQSLNNKITKTEWKQEAYRSIISKMYSFSGKYMSYSSNTNLLSSSFFSKATTVTPSKDYVTASGKTSSDIVLNSISQLASAAKLTTSSNITKNIGENAQTITGGNLDKILTGEVDVGKLNGSITLTYGSKDITLSFDEFKDSLVNKDEDGNEISTAQALANAINSKLADQKITLSNGTTVSANERIEVTVTEDKNTGKSSLSFSDKSNAGNSVYISSATKTIKNVLGLDLTDADKNKDTNTISFNKDDTLSTKQSHLDVFKSEGISITFNGVQKTIKLPNDTKDSSDFLNKLNGQLEEAFQGGVEANIKDGNLVFNVHNSTDELLISSSINEVLGLNDSQTNYLTTSETLSELLGDKLNTLTSRVDEKTGKRLYEFKINGVSIGEYSADSKLSDIMSDINSNTEAGVKVSYSKLSKQFVFTAKETGATSGINLENGLATELFGTKDDKNSVYVEGKNAKFAVTVNGQTMELERNTNSVSLDGLTLNLKQEFGVENRTSLTHTLTKENLKDTTELSFTGDNGTRVTLDVSSYKGDIDAIANAINDTNNDISKYFKADTSSGALVLTAIDPKMDTQLSVTRSTTTTSSTTKTLEKDTKNDGYDISNLKAGDTISFQYKDQTIEYKFTSDDPKEEFKNKLPDLVSSVEITNDDITIQDGILKFKTSDDLKNGIQLKTTQSNTTTSTTNYAAKIEYKNTEAVTFETKADSDKIVDAIKTMLEDYNAIISEIKSAYSTQPLTNSSGNAYDPLSDEDMSGMTESAISKYEEKAKTGLLFGDSNLSSLYQKLRYTFSGSDVNLLAKMGISTSYSSVDGSLSITLDESKLRDMLDNNPDAVEEVFTKEGGIMQGLKSTFDRYAATTGAQKGILVQKSGTPLSSLSLLDNTWQDEIDRLNDQIEDWQDKLSTKVDYYTSQFTRLETLMSQMNSQSSLLAGLSGG